MPPWGMLRDVALLAGLHVANGSDDLATGVMPVQREGPLRDGVDVVGGGDAVSEDFAQLAQLVARGVAIEEPGEAVGGVGEKSALAELVLEHGDTPASDSVLGGAEDAAGAP